MTNILPSHVFQSRKLFRIYFILKFSPAALNWSSLCSRRITTVLSASVRNLAVSGKSSIIQKEAAPARTVARPSRIKIHAQAGLPPIPFMFEMAAWHIFVSHNCMQLGLVNIRQGVHQTPQKLLPLRRRSQHGCQIQSVCTN